MLDLLVVEHLTEAVHVDVQPRLAAGDLPERIRQRGN
jgi:hypothetical protein